MSNPVRVEYWQNADYFMQAQTQSPIAAKPLIPEKIQNIFFGVLIVGTVVFTCVQEGVKHHSFVLPVVAGIFATLILAFWLWFFKRIGLDRTTPASTYRWKEKDRARLEKRLRKKFGSEELLVAWQFDETGMRLNPEKPASTAYEWGAVARALESPGGLFIYLGRWTHIWFPATAFATPEQYAEVCDIIQRHVANFERFGPRAWAYIALGSNMGNSSRIIEDAIVRLGEFSAQPLFVSSLWRTTPVDCPPDSPEFVNAVIALRPRPDETPETLLARLQELERKFGRGPKKAHNEPRPLDLDLLAFGAETRATPALSLPHPRAHQRRFVLQPFSEIAPNFVLPGQSKTVTALLAELRSDETIRRL